MTMKWIKWALEYHSEFRKALQPHQKKKHIDRTRCISSCWSSQYDGAFEAQCRPAGFLSWVAPALTLGHLGPCNIWPADLNANPRAGSKIIDLYNWIHFFMGKMSPWVGSRPTNCYNVVYHWWFPWWTRQNLWNKPLIDHSTHAETADESPLREIWRTPFPCKFALYHL